MFLVLAAYLLLAMPVLGSVTAAFSAPKGEAIVRIKLAGFYVIHHTTVAVGENGWPLSAAPIWGAPERKKKSEKNNLRKNMDSAARRTARIEKLDVSMRIGLGEAWCTAMAAGGAKAALYSALSVLRTAEQTRVCVIPDFADSVFCVQLRCIFFVTAGDIMLRAVISIIKKAAEKGFFHAAASH